MATKPTQYLGWVPDGSPTKIAVPPASLQTSGWSAGQAPPAQIMNWLFYLTDQWITWLDSATSAGALSNNIGATQGMRLVGGGNWSWSATSTTLSYSLPFSIAIPSAADGANTISAGSVSIPVGSLAYINANIPFSTTGTTTSGSTLLTGLASSTGISAGQTVAGTNIPAGTTVAGISGTTVTMSQNATGSGNITATFCGAGGVSVQTAVASTFVPAANTVILAICRADSGDAQPICLVGVNSEVALFYDGETKRLLASGYVTVRAFTAGETLAALVPVYIAGVSDGGRTAGSVYQVDASAANGAARATYIGVTATATAAGASVLVVASGYMVGFSSLVPGSVYYADPAAIGGITATRPAVTNQYLVPVGVAVSTVRMLLVPPLGPPFQIIPTNSWPNYAAGNETQLAAALSAASGLGGVIVLTGPFTITSQYYLPDSTIILGRRSASVITLGAGGGLHLINNAELRDVHMTTAQTSGNSVSLQGNYSILRTCRIQVPSAGTNSAVGIDGSGNRVYNCIFAGVLGSATATGIAYNSGTNNLDDSSVFFP